MLVIAKRYVWLDVLTDVVDIISDHVGVYFMTTTWSLRSHIGFDACVLGLVHPHLVLFLFFHRWHARR